MPKSFSISLIVFLGLSLLFPLVSTAHPGRTASDGCHYCRTNCDYYGVAWDERHCHNGATAPIEDPPLNPPDRTNRFLTAPEELDEPFEGFTVSRVVDGDTIKVNSSLGLQTVRLIGIDTPETVHPSKPVECFGKEASAYLSDLLPAGTAVVLTMDSIGDTVDKYDRLLRYVELDGDDLNAKMVADGYAYAYTTYPFSRSTSYVAFEELAKGAELGLWAPGVCDVPALETDDQEEPPDNVSDVLANPQETPTPTQTAPAMAAPPESTTSGSALVVILILVAGVGGAIAYVIRKKH